MVLITMFPDKFNVINHGFDNQVLWQSYNNISIIYGFYN